MNHITLKLSFKNIWSICLNFVDCEFFLESNSPDILDLCETNLNDSIDSGNLSVRGYLPLLRKDSSTHMYGLALWSWRKDFLFHGLTLENSADSYLCFWLALLHSMSYFFFLYGSPSSSLCMVFDSISSNIDEVLSINPSANVFVFGDFNVHHKDWLTYSGGTDRLVNSVIVFLSQITLFRWLTFLLRSQAVIFTVLVFWISFFLLTLVFILQWLSLHWEILIILLSQFPLTFHHIHNRMHHIIEFVMTYYSHPDSDGLCHHLRDVPWEDIFKLSASDNFSSSGLG